MRIVSNSSPLIGLSIVGKYRLLKEVPEKFWEQ